MVDIHRHRHDVEAHVQENKSKTVLQLYRENVCAQAAALEVELMGEATALRIVACYIWRRNYTGITRQFTRRRALLRNAVLTICRIGRSTLWRTLSAAGISTEIEKQQQQVEKQTV